MVEVEGGRAVDGGQLLFTSASASAVQPRFSRTLLAVLAKSTSLIVF